jgi:hypothetical protein
MEKKIATTLAVVFLFIGVAFGQREYVSGSSKTDIYAKTPKCESCFSVFVNFSIAQAEINIYEKNFKGEMKFKGTLMINPGSSFLFYFDTDRSNYWISLAQSPNDKVRISTELIHVYAD